VATAYDGSLACKEDPIMYDYEDPMGANMAVSQGAYAEARDWGTGDRSLAAFPHIAELLTANGHSPYKAAEIILIAQRSWSKNLS
jgi:hypothetical protein